eukprot:551242_1
MDQLKQNLNDLSKTEPNYLQQRNTIIGNIIHELNQNDNKAHLSLLFGIDTSKKIISTRIIANTGLFWYQRHGWTLSNIKNFFEIAGINEDDLLYEFNDVAPKIFDNEEGVKSKEFQPLFKDGSLDKIWQIMTINAETENTDLSPTQFNIALVNSNIHVDPDVSTDLFFSLLQIPKRRAASSVVIKKK